MSCKMVLCDLADSPTYCLGVSTKGYPFIRFPSLKIKISSICQSLF